MITIDKQHVYRVDGRIVPHSVTGVLVDANITDKRWYTEEGRINGQRRHYVCQLAAEDDLNEASVDPSDLPYLKADRLFIQATRWVSRYVEQPIYSDILDCAGCPDDIGYFPGDSYLTILDRKMGCRGAAAIQTAGYSIIYEHHYGALKYQGPTTNNLGRAIGRCALQLRPNGTYRYQKYPVANLRTDINTFLHAVEESKRERGYSGE